jgi:tRNA(adenine34) deaminase
MQEIGLFHMNTTDEKFMRIAIAEAAAAGELGEVPIGACLVDASGEVVAKAGNRTITNTDPTAHAEILVLREAARITGNYRLTETTMYSTVEPCAMCAGALVNARIERLVFGTYDVRFGAAGSIFDICSNPKLNHRIETVANVLTDECLSLIQDFFRAKRKKSD